jgi:prepilin-type processing-associated H-X9-DG protein
LVVIAIIGILVAILLPAVQATREAARRTQCGNNLRQIAVAVTNYENGRRMFPPAGLTDTAINENEFFPISGPMFSWIVLILPYLEEDELYSQFDFEKTVLQQDSDAQARHLSVLMCPSDDARGKYFVHPELTEGKRLAKGNYVAYVSPFHVENHPRYPGALVGHRRQRARDVVDGFAKTILASEVRVRDREHDQRGAWALPWTGSSLISFDMHAIQNEGPYIHNERSIGMTQRPNNQGPNVDMLYECLDEADAQLRGMPCAAYTEAVSPNHYLSAAPRSQHPGGVNVVYLDGHVKFLTDRVDEVAMAYTISIADRSHIHIRDD